MPKHWQAALFKKFEIIWGDKWTSKFESDEKMLAYRQEWALALVVLSKAELARGVELARAECAWPPNIAEFMALARRKDVTHVGAAYRVYRPALPKPVNRELAYQALSSIRRAL